MFKLRKGTALAAAAFALGGMALSALPAKAAAVTCGSIITTNTTLDSDVGPCAGDGLVVTASNVTIDLAGFKVFAATSVAPNTPPRTSNGAGDNAGIRLAMVTGVTVKGGTVELFDAGVVIGGGSANTVTGVTAQKNVNDFIGGPCEMGDGIAMLNSSNNMIVGNKAINNGPFGGISVVGDGNGNVIKNNVASDNNVVGSRCGNSRQDEGVRIEGPGADDNVVKDNLVERNLLAGIGLHGYVCSDAGGDDVEEPNRGSMISGNVVRGTAGTPIAAGINFLQQGPAGVVCPAFGNTIDKNVSTGNEGDGIFVAAGSHDNVINRNVVDNNDLSGIFLNDPSIQNVFTNVGPSLLDALTPDLPAFTEGTDYLVMSGSGSGDRTARLVGIDLSYTTVGGVNTNPVDTSTSGCEVADYTAAGFVAGDIALIQRGTCTFVAKVNLAIAQGASAVVMFNEGQAGRTSANFGGVGAVTIPVLSTTYAVGTQLDQLADPTTVRVVTNTTNEMVVAARAPYDNQLTANRGRGNVEADGYDGNLEPPCDNNKWRASHFGTVNQPCVVGPGGSGEARGRTGTNGRSGEAGQDVGRNAPTGM